jgi:hypothetical protein
MKILENFDAIRVHAKKIRVKAEVWVMFNFYDIKTNGITHLIIDSPMTKPRIISLPSISEASALRIIPSCSFTPPTTIVPS